MAKDGKDRISVVQTQQDIAVCAEKFSSIRCRAISVQSMSDKVIALFELTVQGDEVKVVDERHYKLVPADRIDPAALRAYRNVSAK